MTCVLTKNIMRNFYVYECWLLRHAKTTEWILFKLYYYTSGPDRRCPDLSRWSNSSNKNINYSQNPLNTHKKIHQNRSSRLAGVQLQTHVQKIYICKDTLIVDYNQLSNIWNFTIRSKVCSFDHQSSKYTHTYISRHCFSLSSRVAARYRIR